MIRGRSKQVHQEIRPAASTLAQCRIDLAQQQRNIMEKIGARVKDRPASVA